MRQIKTISQYIVLSLIGILLAFIVILLESSHTNRISFDEKLFFLGAFIISCLFGITIAIYPRWWKKIIKKVDRTSDIQQKKRIKSFSGHHPDCGVFKNHIIVIRNKPWCAGCLGLISGSIISIFLIIIFLFVIPDLPSNMFYFIFALGLILLIFVYMEIILPKRYAILHVILNIALVFSFFCITISVVGITENLTYGLLTIVLCFLWLDTRIQLSNWNHTKMCESCIESCKMY